MLKISSLILSLFLFSQGTSAEDSSSEGWSEEKEKIFQEKLQSLFKKSSNATSSPQEVVMPLYYENSSHPLGNILTQVEEGKPLLLEKQNLVEYLKRLVIADWFKEKKI